MSKRFSVAAVVTWIALGLAALPAQANHPIYETTGVRGGLVIHVGSGDGKVTAALALDGYQIHGLDTSEQNVERTRQRLQSKNLYPRATADRFDGKTLPYIDNLANLVIVENAGDLSQAEIMRVLAPKGVAYVQSDGQWKIHRKPRPTDIDEWTHYLYDPSNNAVAKDKQVGPPKRLQWVAGPRYSRHHDKMSSMSAMVTAQGRVFYVFDEAPRVSVLFPPEWKLIARDAFNGTVLWKRSITKWQPHLWPLKSGPAQLPRRLVAIGDKVYVTLAIDGPVMALDAATGKTLHTYEGTEGCEEILVSGNQLFALTLRGDPQASERAKRRGKTWKPTGWAVHAVDLKTNQKTWQHDGGVLPNTLALNKDVAVFHDGEGVVCLDRKSGKQKWKSVPIGRAKEIRSFFSPTLVIYKDVVLFAGGEEAGTKGGGWNQAIDSMSSIDLATGKELWKAKHFASGYRSSEDLLVVDGLVWTGDTTSGRAKGLFEGRDPRSGKVIKSFEPDVDTYWFHHRCYRGKASDKFLLMSRTGVEFIDVKKESWDINHFVRGACLYGIMPANGLLYAPQHPCACYLEAKLVGFNALAPAASKPLVEVPDAERLVKGPAFGQDLEAAPSQEDWKSYRHNSGRTGHATTTVSASLESAWQTKLGGKLTAPIVADGKLFVASVTHHAVHAIDTESGKPLWKFNAGGRVDSPPTYRKGRVYFGSADGWVYCLRASDGRLIWRFLAAIADRRTMTFERLESLWPLHGSVLIQDNSLYFVAGRSMFLDGGLRLWHLDPVTGQILSKTVLDDKEQGTGKKLQSFISWLNMPTGLPDVLSSDGKLVYMRSQPFDLDGKRLPLKAMPRRANADQGAPDAVQGTEHAHLFCPTGFLDDSYWHRTYWMYGTMFVSGWQGYYRAGKSAPAGRILVSDDKNIYGFGRKPKYWRWTTPIEHHLFASPKKGSDKTETPEPTEPKGPKVATVITVDKSKNLDTSNKPVTVSAWIRPSQANGVVLARGGSAMGYSLYLKKGQPHFAARSGKKLAVARGAKSLKSAWFHVAGVMDGKQLRLYVNGVLTAQAKMNGLITGDPVEGLSIGNDDNTHVGSYEGSAFGGLIDEVRLWTRALSDEQVAVDAKAGPAAKENLILSYSFEKGKPTDGSDAGNHGKKVGAKTTNGRVGKALSFSGKSGSSRNNVTGFGVPYHWTVDMPLLARAMVLDAAGKIFVAGPEDLVDEDKDSRNVDNPETQKRLAEQLDAWEGKRGALLRAVSTQTGEKLSEIKISAPPVFDGMAAARQHLYIVLVDGSVVCLKKPDDGN